MAASPTDPEALAGLIADAAVAACGLLLCTDFDGSLAPIVPDPGGAGALPEAARALRRLSGAGAARGVGLRCPVKVAVVTARDSDDAAGRVELGPEAVVVGNLGLERKRYSAVVHTRGIDDPAADGAAAALAAEVAATHGLWRLEGKHAAEVHVPVRRDKASAVIALRRGGWARAALCAAGDDLMDIPMLRLASRLGPRGIAVAVADDETPAEVLAAADHRIDGPPAWERTLSRLAGLSH